ncbi:MAG: excinuclease ABC subunit C [Candidatus Magasanikbacteria bacterium CG10_big_fil_rev_8_21_14_0_10_42_10]|uniref:Excinuclease ABC subunit C n=2 Tax=Candidatus Magasanikiibacteriota TaxID=1752731 RepID=A0A2H0TVM3_9BACT|nr:MAG: excinuclease ABC subunit C [Candidatus Magasanikbacteria bacterium CG10_big_fil_rev_8_21_14_0_10_42_10]PIZ93904.1 MAG: excinuclease ABC subunit C [Candidatus Magasanikbacteria bacterium CG_4_10_14_0_2_um_filter_41_10]
MLQGGFIYLLESVSKKHRYLGSTPHPEKRLVEHNRGITKATRDKKPWVLLCTWQFCTLQKAREIEFQIKKQKRKFTIEYISYFIDQMERN